MKKKPFDMNYIASAVLTLLVLVVVALLGDFYFDLNDDVLMKDILSGAYTGVPEGHNIQMLYPVSAFIALFYRVYRGLDWYGIFLCLCQFGCLFILLGRALRVCEDKVLRILSACTLFLFFTGAMLSHLLFVQYTFTCGLLSATAAFLIMTHDEGKKGDLVLAVLLIILAYLMRSEMLLLTLPIVGVGILIRYSLKRVLICDRFSEGIQISTYGEKKSLFKRYVILCLAIVIGLFASSVVHTIAYSRADWREFNALFDARTELYDFQYIPDYEENKAFYDEIQLSGPEQQLLINYNYGIDDEINTSTLRSVAQYADKQKTDEVPLFTRLVQSAGLYFYRLRHVAYQKSYEYPMTDAPLNIIAGILYLGTIVLFLLSKDKKKAVLALFLVVLLFACRSTLWLYIIVRGRDPIRITHPLYIMEIVVLLGMMLSEKNAKKPVIIATLTAASIALAVFIPNQVNVIRDEMEQRDKMRAHYDALYQYFDEHPDDFYFVDVYTGVSATDGDEKTFSEKMFSDVDNSFANHDLMGGWASKSPLYYKKISKEGFSSMQDAILQKNVYVVSKTVKDINWLSDYYLEKGITVSIDKIATVSDVFDIYSVNEAN